MMDRCLARLLHLSVMSLICAAAAFALLLGYHGLFSLVTGGGVQAIAWLGLGAALAFGCCLLCRHRDDLADC